MAEPAVLSVLEAREAELGAHGLAYLRHFLERLVGAAAKGGALVIGEAEVGRYILVMPALPNEVLKEQIDRALDLVLSRLGARWPEPRVTDFGLRELYPGARDPWLGALGFEPLVLDGKVGVVTIFCHNWLFEVCGDVASDHAMGLETSFSQYLETGKVRIRGPTSFQVDVFANVREMAANFYPIDHLVAKLLVVAGLSTDPALAARVVGRPCPSCGTRVLGGASTCPSCGANLAGKA